MADLLHSGVNVPTDVTPTRDFTPAPTGSGRRVLVGYGGGWYLDLPSSKRIRGQANLPEGVEVFDASDVDSPEGYAVQEVAKDGSSSYATYPTAEDGEVGHASNEDEVPAGYLVIPVVNDTEE